MVILHSEFQHIFLFYLEYTRLNPIGLGGYAECYACKHKVSGKDYAVKIINKVADQHVYWA